MCCARLAWSERWGARQCRQVTSRARSPWVDKQHAMFAHVSRDAYWSQNVQQISSKAGAWIERGSQRHVCRPCLRLLALHPAAASLRRRSGQPPLVGLSGAAAAATDVVLAALKLS